ncbi:sigma-54-dependent Fis family transcriptional regulator [Planctomycetes bacterium K23_9]|uniref:Nitrogen fixation protein VnfA n=1 Tax=Stieleria marina TaxID=1930275 RepID=A0A517P2G9_9BACT|nr:Nitrogen fixation protein VnfA [Planctomycetes bacterium K23_9]
MAEANDVNSAVTAEIFEILQQELSREQFRATALPLLLSQITGQTPGDGATPCGGIVRQVQSQWQTDLWVGKSTTLPEDEISDAIDRSAISLTDQWCVAPLPSLTTDDDLPLSIATASALVVRLDGQPAAQSHIQRTTQITSSVLSRIDQRDRRKLRIEQLTAVLNASIDWQRLDDDEKLLHAIADTATELLDCQRASIFLWDKRRKKLIGRPALGIDGGVLEVADSVGIVGEVLLSGEPKLWSADADDEARINRKVDKKTEFQTDSLLAVPMQGGHRGDVIGVFEAINHNNGSFGAFDAAVLSDLATHASVAIEGLRARRTLAQSRDRLVDDAASATKLIGDHPSIQSVRTSAGKVAKTDLSLLILGRNGTGKEVLAQHVHYESNRRNGPFIAVNCAALVESLLESELFGHEKGAFTDANQTRVGKFELANGGTLFLDEVGDMSPGGQAKLLRVLEEKVVVRVGGSQTIPVDVRVIAATNQPLEQLIAERRFREDLFFRLNVVSLTLPSLHQRGDDVLLLAEHFMQHFCYHIGRQVPTLDASARKAMLSHPWPGNVRELRNTIERLCYLTSEDVITAADLTLNTSAASRINAASTSVDASQFPDELTDATRVFQVTHIENAIARSGGNMTDAAASLGLHRSNLYRKMRQLDMNADEE